MKTDFRNRAFLPVVMPLAALGVVALVVGAVATVLLFVDRAGAVAIALLAAAGVLVAASLAASKDRLDNRRRTAIGLAGLTPLVIGALAAAGVVGGISPAERNINVEPHAPQFVFPGIEEGVPVMAAQDVAFCLPSDGGCTETHEWSFTYQESQQIAYAFDNRDTVAHNLYLYNVPAEELAGLQEALPLGTVEEQYRVITPAPPPDIEGGVAQTYRWTPPAGDAPDPSGGGAAGGEGATAAGGPVPVPETAYFVCTIHPNVMWGVVDITPEGA